MKIKCLCVLFYDITRIKKGTFESKERVITVRPSLFEKVHIAVPTAVDGYSLGKNRLLFLCDLKTMIAVPRGKLEITQKQLDDIVTKLDLLSRNKFWRFLGGRAMDIIEMLITLFAGYGMFRLAEVFLVNAFGH